MSLFQASIGRGGFVLHLWIQWAVQILVLNSFFLQVFLLLFGGTRRRGTSAVLRVLLWLAYLTADTVATYTLGHLAITTGSHLHQLLVFWAPFLLLHLGGQDTVTAYALEDNRLWLRHLQTLVLQCFGVIYVLYRCLSGNWRLVAAAILMFILGAIKYGERIWALKCANIISIDCLTDKNSEEVLNNRNLEGSGMEEDEVVMQGAHVLLSICVSLFNDCTLTKTPSYQYTTLKYLVGSRKIYSVIEMELSLMYDMMYTKAGVIHSWYGHCIRLFSVFVIVFAFWQFRVINKDGYSRVDVDITYTLVVGAFVLEMTSWIMAIGSTWTRHFLYVRGWKRLHGVIVCLRRLVIVKAVGWRMWSGNVGQFNVFEYAKRHESIDIQKLNDLPPPMHISAPTRDLVLNAITKIVARHGGEADGLYSLNQRVEGHELPVLDCDFDTRIIIWHIATHAILLFIKDERQQDDCDYEKEIKTLSDYMMFLLVKQPEMLVTHTSRQLCLEALNLVKFVDKEEVVECLSRAESNANTQIEEGKNEPCVRGMGLAKSLVGNGWERHRLLDVVFGAWVVMLCYAGSHCSRESHARRLSTGGEFLTIVWQLAGHLSHYESEKREQDRNKADAEMWREIDRRQSMRQSSSMHHAQGRARMLEQDVELGETSYSGSTKAAAGEGAGDAAPDT